MPATVLLQDIIDALEMQIEEHSSYLDLDTGQVETVSHDLLRQAEERGDDEEPRLPEWQKHEWEIAKRLASTDRFEKLPTKYDVHEWAIMQDFAYSVEPGRIHEDLLHAIHGSGAFRHFKYVVRQHNLEPAWFEFRDEALRDIAVDWCEEHHIAWQ
jgi:uncharacterized protein UPF0158